MTLQDPSDFSTRTKCPRPPRMPYRGSQSNLQKEKIESTTHCGYELNSSAVFRAHTCGCTFASLEESLKASLEFGATLLFYYHPI